MNNTNRKHRFEVEQMQLDHIGEQTRTALASDFVFICSVNIDKHSLSSMSFSSNPTKPSCDVPVVIDTLIETIVLINEHLKYISNGNLQLSIKTPDGEYNEIPNRTSDIRVKNICDI